MNWSFVINSSGLHIWASGKGGEIPVLLKVIGILGENALLPNDYIWPLSRKTA
jgi:hypothetical protein